MKDELNLSYNGGVVVYLLQSGAIHFNLTVVPIFISLCGHLYNHFLPKLPRIFQYSLKWTFLWIIKIGFKSPLGRYTYLSIFFPENPFLGLGFEKADSTFILLF